MIGESLIGKLWISLIGKSLIGNSPILKPFPAFGKKSPHLESEDLLLVGGYPGHHEGLCLDLPYEQLGDDGGLGAQAVLQQERPPSHFLGGGGVKRLKNGVILT